jgi:hypothetical protein
MSYSAAIDSAIVNSIQNYDGSYTLGSSFEELVTMGELVDRLSIVNFKLFKLKDTVMQKKEDKDFFALASVEYVKLCKERSRLKNALDEKLTAMINRIKNGDQTGGFNGETKLYG